VARFGQFSPITYVGYFLLWVVICEVTDEAKIIVPVFHGKNDATILSKNSLGFILGVFSQTHLVTLFVTQKSKRLA
jgi:hypothetical protein